MMRSARAGAIWGGMDLDGRGGLVEPLDQGLEELVTCKGEAAGEGPCRG